MSSRSVEMGELKSVLKNNPPPSVHGLRGTGMEPEEAIKYISEEKAKLHDFSDQCEQWIREAESQERCVLGTLGYQLRQNYESNRPSRRVTLARTLATLTIGGLIRSRWPTVNLEVEAFGSTYCGLDDGDSDLDLIILDHERRDGPGSPTPWNYPADPAGLPEWYDTGILVDVLRQAPADVHIKDVEPLARARVPVVRFVMESYGLGLKIDLVMNNRLALENSKLIVAYCDLRPSLLRPLIFNLKQWLKSRALNDSSSRETGQYSLSSYAIALVTIDYLQHQRELPNLQDRELVRRLRVSSKVLWTGFEEPRALVASPEAHSVGKLSKACNATFFNPSDASQMEEVEYVEDEGSSWAYFHLTSSDIRWNAAQFNKGRMDHSDKIRQMDMAFCDLPSPGAAGFHRADSCLPKQQDHDLGLAYQDFIFWFLRQLRRDGQPIFEISHTLYEDTCRYVNESEPPFFWMSREGGFFNADHSAKDSTQPLEWLQQHLIVRDPFINDLNVARNIKGAAFSRLCEELRRVTDIFLDSRNDRELNLSRLHKPWKLSVAEWELRKRQIQATRRKEDFLSISKLGFKQFDVSEPFELLDVGDLFDLPEGSSDAT